MLWLDARGGAAPLAYNYDNNGPIPTAKGLNLAGHTWTLYIGTNGSQKVYSFVANTLPLKQVNGDLNDFFKKDRLDPAQYLNKVQLGVEATFGVGAFTV
ncbi:hypothetical protein MPER_11775 [Moniliophthora perniciosa FA553]|nr:hypothetical protein MPER_11775 [Moniliophthora perniciosa FA553]